MRVLRSGALLALVVACSLPALAQVRPLPGSIGNDTPLRPVTRALALVNATVVTAPGQAPRRATVIVRDGRIERVAAGAAIPPDARRIAADSLTVYAGFVDAWSTAGLAAPTDPERFTGDPGAAPRERAGRVPDRDVRTLYKADDARIAALREAGFTAAHVVPRDGYLGGRGAVVALRPLGRGETTADLFLQGPASAVARLTGATGVYPTTPMGVMAALREAVENTRRRRAAGPTDRGAYDPVADALDPVAARSLRLWMVTPSALDGFRALRLGREMEVATGLAGVTDPWPLVEALRAQGRADRRGAAVPLILPLALPDTLARDTSAAAGPALAPPAAPPDGRAATVAYRMRSQADLAAERRALRATRDAAMARVVTAAGGLAAAGVPVAFGSFDVEPAKALAALRRRVQGGLSPDVALAALTTGPAALFGLADELGTVEAGRRAHLVVTTGPVFSDSSRLRYVVVDGEVHEIAAPAARARGRAGGAAGANAADSGSVVGSWSYELATPGGTMSGTFTFARAGGALTGTVTVEGAPLQMSSVAEDGDTVTFRFTMLDGTPISATATRTGDRLSGTADTPGGALSFTATRVP